MKIAHKPTELKINIAAINKTSQTFCTQLKALHYASSNSQVMLASQQFYFGRKI